MPTKYKFNIQSENPKNSEVYKPTVYKFPTRAIISHGVKDIFSVDLIDMSKKKSNGYDYILNFVDVSSRKAWSYPIAYKNTHSLLVAFAHQFSIAKPKKLWTDGEGAIYSNDFQKFLENHGVHPYRTQGKNCKNPIVESYNRTMNHAMRENTNNFKNWDKFVIPICEGYNDTIHSSIKTTPNKAYNGEDKGVAEFNNIKHIMEKKLEPKKVFHVGDQVRTQIVKTTFEKKSHTPNWSDEIYSIVEVKKTNPTTYILGHLDDKILKKLKPSYYKDELLKVVDE